MTMAHLARRLTRLETHLSRADAGLPWADVHDALARQQARARLTLCRRLGVDSRDPRLVDAVTLLLGDDEARSAHDAELIARWRRVHGLDDDPGEVRQRLAQRLEAMARRQREASREQPCGLGGACTRIRSARLSASGGQVKSG
jgi:hypothetical protein